MKSQDVQTAVKSSDDFARQKETYEAMTVAAVCISNEDCSPVARSTLDKTSFNSILLLLRLRGPSWLAGTRAVGSTVVDF
jgi:hypothetical protein